MLFPLVALKFVGGVVGYSLLFGFYDMASRKLSQGPKRQKPKSEIAGFEKKKATVERGIEGQRRQKVSEMEATVERGVEAKRREKMAEMEATIAARKEEALNEVSAWVEREEARLREHYEKQYETEVATMKGASITEN